MRVIHIEYSQKDGKKTINNGGTNIIMHKFTCRGGYIEMIIKAFTSQYLNILNKILNKKIYFIINLKNYVTWLKINSQKHLLPL